MRCGYLLGLLACAAGLARAQDPFEIHVYEYETLHPGQFTLEAHLNYVGSGTKDYQGPLLRSKTNSISPWSSRPG